MGLKTPELPLSGASCSKEESSRERKRRSLANKKACRVEGTAKVKCLCIGAYRASGAEVDWISWKDEEGATKGEDTSLNSPERACVNGAASDRAGELLDL